MPAASLGRNVQRGGFDFEPLTQRGRLMATSNETASHERGEFRTRESQREQEVASLRTKVAESRAEMARIRERIAGYGTRAPAE